MTSSPPARADDGESLSHRLALYAATAICIALVAVELGYVSSFRHAWGFTLWQYLPPFVSYALALAVLALCVPLPRAYFLRALARLHAIGRTPAASPFVWALILALPFLLLAVRERHFLGDSKILLFALAARDTQFYFPDVGATYLLKWFFEFGQARGWGGIAGVQVLVCLAVWPALWCFVRVGGYLAPRAGWAAFATALMIVGGVTRIYAGHVEVYSVVLIGLAAYFWAALAYLHGRCGWTIPCLALGFGLWIHLCFLFLIPSLLLLPVLVEPPRPLRERIAQWTYGLALTAVPLVGFLVLLVVIGEGRDVMLAWTKLINWSEVGGGREHYETVWIRPPWEPESGSKYALYSRLHLKYLANSFFLLAPAVVPVVLAYAIFSPRRLWTTPEAAFLSTASVAMLGYASIVRPVFGPYEWDLFTVTAVCLAALAAHLLATTRSSPTLQHLCALLIGATALFVAIPWVIVGAAVHRSAGPFAIDALHASPDGSFYEGFVRELAPWL